MFFEGMDFYSFPKVEKLAFASQNDLRDCGLGYRNEYLQGTAKKIYEDKIELETFKRLPYDQVRKSLIEFPGVGPKVADCVLLFSLEKMNAFPIDVWVKRAILHHYVSQLQEDLVKKLLANNSMSNSVYEKINAFGRKYFGDYAGYAQEYLYHYERSEL